MDELTPEWRERLRERRREEVRRYRRPGSLYDAIITMTGRYGSSRQCEGLYSDYADQAIRDYHDRASTRRFRAMQRIASQLMQ